MVIFTCTLTITFNTDVTDKNTWKRKLNAVSPTNQILLYAISPSSAPQITEDLKINIITNILTNIDKYDRPIL